MGSRLVLLTIGGTPRVVDLLSTYTGAPVSTHAGLGLQPFGTSAFGGHS